MAVPQILMGSSGALGRSGILMAVTHVHKGPQSLGGGLKRNSALLAVLDISNGAEDCHTPRWNKFHCAICTNYTKYNAEYPLRKAPLYSGCGLSKP